jgi:Replication-relaxation
MLMPIAKRRSPLFERVAEPPAIILTQRDPNHLARVARHRFLSSTQLALLDGGSPQNVLRSLRALFDHGYLDRPRAQIVSMIEGGSQPIVYALGRKGARVLREHGHRVDADVDWTEKNRRTGAVFIEHTLEVADFMTALEIGCRHRSDVSLIAEHEIIAAAPEQTRRSREPLRWIVERVERGRKDR